jgi:purine-binding chemotaxis protein CheW
LLVLHLAGQAYGIPLKEVREVVPLPHLFRPPSLPAVLAGFLNLAGTAIPVLRLGHLFGLPDQPPGLHTPLVVLRHPDTHLALMVDRVTRILAVSADAILPLPENHSFNDCVEGMVTDADHVVLLLSPERILLEKEQQCLAEFQDREQARLRDLEVPTS